MIHIRYSKIILVLCCALLAGLPGLNNLLDYNINLEHVRHVLSMDTHVVESSVKEWRSIEKPILHHMAYILIILAEWTIGILGLWGGLDLWNARHNAALFNRKKTKAIWAMTLGLLVWFFGFMVIGGEWFLMWLSADWNSQQSAFRLVVPFMITLMFLSMKDEDEIRI